MNSVLENGTIRKTLKAAGVQLKHPSSDYHQFLICSSTKDNFPYLEFKPVHIHLYTQYTSLYDVALLCIFLKVIVFGGKCYGRFNNSMPLSVLCLAQNHTDLMQIISHINFLAHLIGRPPFVLNSNSVSVCVLSRSSDLSFLCRITHIKTQLQPFMKSWM